MHNNCPQWHYAGYRNSSFAYWELRSENLWSADPNFQLALYQSSVSGAGSYCITAGNSTDSNHTPLVTAACGPFTTNGLQIWNL